MQIFSKLNLFYRLPVIIFCLIIFWQSAFPGVDTGLDLPHIDKLMHFMCYALLSALILRDLLQENLNFKFSHLAALAFFLAFFYGATDELHQYFVPSRQADFFDLLADGAGALAGVISFCKITLFLNSR